jgi:DNA-binding transcriptional MerR regulator
MILGSEIYAVQGVSTCSIGKKSGKATRIHCGVDFTALQEQDRLNHNLRNIGLMLARIEKMMNAENEAGGADKGRLKKMEDAAKKLQDEQQKASAALIEVLKRLNADETAFVEVRGKIATGTLIEICQIALFVTEPLERVRLRLERAAGKIITETLEKR